ncbi:MAG TPA: hypothetical protein VLC46_05860 [Thermoanaerobaculia bacterium]|jgi:hypothetical protein|nr:hypothetical protein [Thermoanaerobaculia bacterium]
MSTQNVVPATPSPVSYTDAAQALIDQTRAMRQQIPNFVVPTSPKELSRLIPNASVTPEFVELSAVAVKNNVPLVRGGDADPAQTRDLMSYADAYGPLADELEALAQLIRHSIIAARSRAGGQALTTYALAKALAKRPETADLALHVADMRRALGRTRKAKSQPAPAPAPVPTERSPVTPSSPATPSK